MSQTLKQPTPAEVDDVLAYLAFTAKHPENVAAGLLLEKHRKRTAERCAAALTATPESAKEKFRELVCLCREKRVRGRSAIPEIAAKVSEFQEIFWEYIVEPNIDRADSGGMASDASWALSLQEFAHGKFAARLDMSLEQGA